MAVVPKVVVVGAGFGGLEVARGLKGAPVEVTLVDVHNFHTFQPLLYQVATAARQLQANLGRAERRTHPAGLAVYGRRGQPCHRCGTPIRMTRHGEQARSTYWCPSCQLRPQDPTGAS